MNPRDRAIVTAAQMLAVADELEPENSPHLLMTIAELRALLEAGQVPRPVVDEVVHHATHEHRAAKIAFLAESWSPPPRCPQCGGRGLEIVYGMPPRELGDLADMGVIAIGGCVVDIDQPTWQCGSCGFGWR